MARLTREEIDEISQRAAVKERVYLQRLCETVIELMDRLAVAEQVVESARLARVQLMPTGANVPVFQTLDFALAAYEKATDQHKGKPE